MCEAQAEDQGVRWQALLKADATFAGSAVIGKELASWTRLARRTRRHPRHRPRRAVGVDAPHGLWLPVPAGDPHATPALDGRTVHGVDRVSEWAVLDWLSLRELRGLGPGS
ncbi:hypothetical protein [Streptomyces sp. NRRL S-4]|uniref:hypothetical protein n=1 Tax=Streptomyces sp. NRRL S-4 TaxID=1519471 RepID=UPI00131AB8CB|nr:hypothetical protein [Streptomyces sp. NRRL S-4]